MDMLLIVSCLLRERGEERGKRGRERKRRNMEKLSEVREKLKKRRNEKEEILSVTNSD